MTEVLDVSAIVDILAEALVRKTLDISMSMSISRSHKDLEFLILR